MTTNSTCPRCQTRYLPTGGCLCDTPLKVKGDDPVNPPYYRRGGHEVADIIEAFGLNFNRGTALRYLLRAGRKQNEIEDLQKLIWYITREITALEKAVMNPEKGA